ncbi:MAG: hypothetical protein AB1744_14435, partial [Candidatus Zixiibacteriota bacterium]
MLSKSLPVEQYGTWSLFISIIGLVLTFSSLNLMYASQIQLTGKSMEHRRSEIFSVGLFKLGVTLVVFAGFAVYLQMKQILAGATLWYLLAALMFRTVNDMVFGFLRALLLLRRQVLFLAVESALILAAIGLYSLVLSGGLIGAMRAFIAAEAIVAALGLYLLRDYLEITGFQFGTVRQYLIIGLPLVPFAFSDLIINSLAPLLLRLFADIRQVAQYSIAQKVAMVSTIPMSIINNIYAQYMKRACQEHGNSGVRSTFVRFLALYVLMAGPIFVGLWLFGRDIIRIVSTEE